MTENDIYDRYVFGWHGGRKPYHVLVRKSRSKSGNWIAIELDARENQVHCAVYAPNGDFILQRRASHK